jgi:hypothetical protein
VTFLVTDLWHVRRTPYIAILTALALGLLAWDMTWSGTSLGDLVADNWALAILAAIVVAVISGLGLRRIGPATARADDAIVRPFVWEGVVYGIAEALLLAVVPVLAVWQASDALGWTDGGAAKIAAGALAIVGSLAVILVHHLGYREFRGREGGPALIGALVGCGLQAIAFLLTGNVLAPVLAHIVLHWQIVLRGMELPPREATGPSRAPSRTPRPRPSFAPAG